MFAGIELDVQFHYKKYLNLRCQYFVCYFYAAALNCLCYVNATLPELDIIATVEPLHAILSLSKGFTLQCHCHCLSFLSLSNLLSSCTCLKPLVKRKIWRSCKHINQEKTLLFCLLLLIHNWLGELLLLRRQHARSNSFPKLQCIALLHCIVLKTLKIEMQCTLFVALHCALWNASPNALLHSMTTCNASLRCTHFRSPPFIVLLLRSQIKERGGWWCNASGGKILFTIGPPPVACSKLSSSPLMSPTAATSYAHNTTSP